MSTRRLIGTTLGAAAAAWLLGTVGVAPAELEAAARSPQGLVDAAGADGLLLAVATAGAWLVWAWGVLGLVLTAASAVPGALGAGAGALLRVVLPVGARRAAAVLVGVSLATAGPALLTGVGSGAPGGLAVAQAADAASWAPGEVASGRDAGPTAAVPDWPTGDLPGTGPGSAALADDAVPDWPEVAAGAHVVVRGDCLWDVATSWLQARDGAPPTGAAVAAAVRDWWTANAEVIGPDPDVLLPGQVLAPPA